MSAVLHSSSQSVSTLLVRFSAFEILVPKAVVHDVMSLSKSKYIYERASSNRLHVGKYTWNDQILPLLCMDRLVSSDAAIEFGKSKVAVLRSVEEGSEFYYALEARGLPKPLIIDERSLYRVDEEGVSDIFAYVVRIGSRKLYVPNIEQLEQVALNNEGL